MRRPNVFTEDDIDRFFVKLGYPPGHAKRKLAVANTLQECEQNLEELKTEAKTAWKKKAFELHPDRNDGLDEEFKSLKQIYEAVMGIRVVEQKRPMVYRWNVTSSTTTSAASYPGGMGWTVTWKM